MMIPQRPLLFSSQGLPPAPAVGGFLVSDGTRWTTTFFHGGGSGAANNFDMVSIAVGSGAQNSLRISGAHDTAATSRAQLLFAGARGTPNGSNTANIDTDVIGLIGFSGRDTNVTSREFARILARVRGTPGATTLPGELRFSTTATGGVLTAQWAIINDGHLHALDAARDIGASGVAGNSPRTIFVNTSYAVGALNVVGARKTGWSVATGTATRTSFDTTTVTTELLAQRVKALIDDLHATAGHGLIGA